MRIGCGCLAAQPRPKSPGDLQRFLRQPEVGFYVTRRIVRPGGCTRLATTTSQCLATLRSPLARARACLIAARTRVSPGTADSQYGEYMVGTSATYAATARRSSTLRACGGGATAGAYARSGCEPARYASSDRWRLRPARAPTRVQLLLIAQMRRSAAHRVEVHALQRAGRMARTIDNYCTGLDAGRPATTRGRRPRPGRTSSGPRRCRSCPPGRWAWS